MTTIIGIPRALMFHFYPYSTYAFFHKLGVRIVFSPVSDKIILDDGVKSTITDNCLPLKIYFGHVKALIDQVDYLFIPRLVSLQKREYMCPKFIGIPDLVVQTFPKLEHKILSPEINLNKKQSFWKAAENLGKRLAIPKYRVLKSYLTAKNVYNKKKKEQSYSKNRLTTNIKSPKIALIGHEYVLHDKLMGTPIINILNRLGCHVLTSSNLQYSLNRKTYKLIPKELYWTKNKILFESAIYLSNNGLVDGIIQINTFPCGPDSVISDLIEKMISKYSYIPTMTIVLDEHTALSGIQTRIEAFIDLINRRNHNDGDISSYGEILDSR